MTRTTLVSLVAAWLVAACGFHLRGDVAYTFPTISVTSPTPQPIVVELKRYLDSSSSTKLVDNAKDATVTPEIVSVNDDKGVLGAWWFAVQLPKIRVEARQLIMATV